MTLPCIRCNRALASVLPEDAIDAGLNQPYAGTAFLSYGHYGSTAFDPPINYAGVRAWIELNVCDDCLLKAAKAGKVLYGRQDSPPRPKVTLKVWVPGEEKGEEKKDDFAEGGANGGEGGDSLVGPQGDAGRADV